MENAARLDILFYLVVTVGSIYLVGSLIGISFFLFSFLRKKK